MAAVSGVRLLVGTRKGLFVARSDEERACWDLEGPFIEGYEIYHAILDPRDSLTGWAAARHEVWGTHIHRTTDGGRSWQPVTARPRYPSRLEREVKAIWHIAPGSQQRPKRVWAGVQPAGLFRSDDAGESWHWVESLERHPSSATWQPAKGGLALHSIQADPTGDSRIYVALSAGGCYRSDDQGDSWQAVNRGVRADFLPDPLPESGQCVHCLRAHPSAPGRLYQQNHCGTYRSDDFGESWEEITADLPSDFGYVVGLDPADPDRAWVIPEESSHLRVTCDARLRVYETRDAGRSWVARTEGLPQSHAYVTVLREALATDGLEPCGVYFGTATGHLYASPDGSRWILVASHLPKILSVTVAPAD
jgi:photosystem II stability/assembly factor-like uncharacterized protein